MCTYALKWNQNEFNERLVKQKIRVVERLNEEETIILGDRRESREETDFEETVA